jgi:NhaP-type Na+/H+ or K+/H+ antiporter
MLIESESLLNDGTAAVAFAAVLGVLSGGHQTVLSISGALFVTIIGGVLIGGTVAYLFMLLADAHPITWWKSRSPRWRRMAHFLPPSTIIARACSRH